MEPGLVADSLRIDRRGIRRAPRRDRALVLRDPDIQPLSVRLPILAPTTDLGVFIAALTISSIIPIAPFLLFQRCSCRAAA